MKRAALWDYHVAGAKTLAVKLKQQAEYSVDLKISIIAGASHTTAFPSTAIQGLDWLYGKKTLQ